MPTLQVSLQVTLDGVPMPNFSIVRRLVVDGVVPFDTVWPATSGASVVPGGINPAQSALVRPLDEPVAVTFVSPITVDAGGFFLLFGGSMSSIKVNNQTASTTQLQGFTAGEAP